MNKKRNPGSIKEMMAGRTLNLKCHLSGQRGVLRCCSQWQWPQELGVSYDMSRKVLGVC